MASNESTSVPSSNPTSLPDSDLGTTGSSYSGTAPGSSSLGGSKTMDRMVRGAHEAVDRFAEKAAPAVERLRGRVSGASDSMHSRADQLGELQEEWVESARTAVREHPIASIGVAVVAGMVLSKMLSSR